MTETLSSFPSWQQQSGHYVDLDYFPMGEEMNYFSHDFNMEFEPSLLLPLEEEEPLQSTHSLYQDEDQGYNTTTPSGIILSETTNSALIDQQQTYHHDVASPEPSQYSQQQWNAYYAQQAIAVGLAQQAYYYGGGHAGQYHPTTVQDSDISPFVYAKLHAKKDQPFENVNREVHDHHHEIVRPKKRLKKTVDLPPPNTFTNFVQYKEALNSMDSISFETYISQVQNFYRFSPSENEEIKAIRGRIKNREAARKSRMKKKNKPMVLEDTVRELMSETNVLEQRLSQLKQERVELYNETSFLTNTISTLLGNKEFADLYRNFYESLKLNPS